jgi:hypothetical protein
MGRYSTNSAHLGRYLAGILSLSRADIKYVPTGPNRLQPGRLWPRPDPAPAHASSMPRPLSGPWLGLCVSATLGPRLTCIPVLSGPRLGLYISATLGPRMDMHPGALWPRLGLCPGRSPRLASPVLAWADIHQAASASAQVSFCSIRLGRLHPHLAGLPLP